MRRQPMTCGPEDSSIYVDGNSIVAPADARIFDVSGRAVGRDRLPCGIYIVHTSYQTVKVAVNY